MTDQQRKARDEAAQLATDHYDYSHLSEPTCFEDGYVAGAEYWHARARVLESEHERVLSEIERGKNKNCIACVNGSDMPEENLCRACWRIWVGGKMYLLWDWETSETKAREALTSYRDGGGAV